MSGAAVTGWRRIDIRSIPVEVIPWFIRTYVGYLLAGSFFPPWVEVDETFLAQGALAVAAWGVVRAVVRWATTFWVLEGTRLRCRTGWLWRSRVSVERSLVRNVSFRADLTARALGVTTFAASAAQHRGDVTVSMASIPVDDARKLREDLLGGAVLDEVPTTLARVRPSWALWAPFSSASIGLWAGAYAVIYNVFFAWFAWIRTWYWLVTHDISWEQGVRALVVAPIVVGIVGAVVLYLEFWWRFRLERHPSGTLRTIAGLVVRREVAFREERIVGIEFTEPLLTRFGHRVRVLAVTTGAGSQRTIQARLPNARKRILMPLGPTPDATRTVSAVVGEPLDLTDLRGHPVQARRQRLRWAGASFVAVTVTVWWLLHRYAPDHVDLTWGAGAVMACLAFVFAIDNYRALGHRLLPESLLVRSGTMQRRTAVIARDSIVGWVFRQTYFQWRLGLVTMVASTAAGSGGYHVRDVGVGEGVGLAREISPGLLTPLDEEEEPPAPRRRLSAGGRGRPGATSGQGRGRTKKQESRR